MARTRTIGRLAKEAGVGVETIRFYERRGLIKQPNRVDGAYRDYDDRALATVRYIKVAQNLGMSLRDIEQITRNMASQTGFCSTIRATARRKLDEIDRELSALAALRDELGRFLARCGARDAALPCPILEEIAQLDSPLNERSSKARRT